uniref:Uncharacterized protein n=1 Tax=Entamoeba histolytica TaxID=5759 RepID=S0B288_ENTHI|nr:hypothetical protein [Entamoeba histolytica]
MSLKREKQVRMLSDLDTIKTCDFLANELFKYLQKNCYLSFFDDNMDVKRQIDEITERNDGSVVSEYKELFTNLIEAYGEGTPTAAVAQMCLDSVKEFEIQYIMPDDNSKERRREGRGLLDGETTLKKKKIENLIGKFAKRIIMEDKYETLDDLKSEKTFLINRKDEIEKEIAKLTEELKDSIELISPEPIDKIERKDFKDPFFFKKNKIKKSKKVDDSSSFQPPPINSALLDTVDESIPERSNDELRNVVQKMMNMNGSQLLELKNIIDANADETVKFDLNNLSDDTFKLMKNTIMKSH